VENRDADANGMTVRASEQANERSPEEAREKKKRNEKDRSKV